MALSDLDLLAKAVAADAAEGPYVAHRGDEVLFRLLDVVGRRARGEMPKRAAELPGAPQAPRLASGQGAGATSAPKAAVRPARAASAVPQSATQQPARDDARVRAAAAAEGAPEGWSREQVEAALNDGVARGKITGTDAMAALKAFDARR